MPVYGNFHVIPGSNKKPVVTETLIDFFSKRDNPEGFLYTGYPILGSSEGACHIDAVLVSKKYRVVVFDLVESGTVGDYEERQYEIYTSIHSFLIQSLAFKKRDLKVDINIIIFAPVSDKRGCDDYPIATDENGLEKIEWQHSDLYAQLHSVMQSLSSIRKIKKRPK